MTRRWGARAGMAGPLALALVIIALSVLQYDEMRALGWHPWRAPTFDWPSGLALGRFGAVMTMAFAVCGVCVVLFAAGLRACFLASGRGVLPAWCFACAGVGLAGLAFTTDPTLTTRLSTWHGRLHDGAFGLLGVSIAMGLLSHAFADAQRGRWPVALLTSGVALLAVAGFALKGLFFYAMFAAVLGWIVLCSRAISRTCDSTV